MTYGYARQLARHFSLEFSLGIGYLTTEYKNILLMREILYGQIVGVITYWSYQGESFFGMVDNNKEIGGRNAKYKIRVSCAFVLAADANWM